MKLNTSITQVSQLPLSKILLIPTICLNNHSGTGYGRQKISVDGNLKIIFYRKAECNKGWASSLLPFLGVQGLQSSEHTDEGSLWEILNLWLFKGNHFHPSESLQEPNLTINSAALTALLSQKARIMQIHPYPPILLFRVTPWVVRTAIKQPQASSDA